MKLQALCRRTTWEIVRDPLNLAFGLGFPLVLLLLLSAIQANIPVSLFEIDRLTPGITVFGLAFVALFSATLVSRDRESALLQRLYTAPLTAGDFIFGYMLPLLPMAAVQAAVCYLAAIPLGVTVSVRMIWAVLLDLPAMITVEGADCAAVVETLRRELRRQETARAARWEDMTAYYTAWVHQIKTPIAAMRLLLQDADGNVQLAHSISAGLDYPGVGPEHAYLKESGRAEYVAIRDDEAMDALMELCRLEGIIPAIESAHAIAYAIKYAKERKEAVGKKQAAEETMVICLSGRGDKDVNTIADYLAGKGYLN